MPKYTIEWTRETHRCFWQFHLDNEVVATSKEFDTFDECIDSIQHLKYAAPHDDLIPYRDQNPDRYPRPTFHVLNHLPVYRDTKTGEAWMMETVPAKIEIYTDDEWREFSPEDYSKYELRIASVGEPVG